MQVPGSVASWPSGSRHRNTHVGTCQSRQGSTPALTPTPRLSAGCKASKGRVTAKGQRTCSPDRVTSHHTGTQCCHPVVKPRVLLPRGLRKMWLSTQQRKQVCYFLLVCTLVYHLLKRHTAWAAQKVLQVFVPVDGSLLSLSQGQALPSENFTLMVRNTGTYTLSPSLLHIPPSLRGVF